MRSAVKLRRWRYPYEYNISRLDGNTDALQGFIHVWDELGYHIHGKYNFTETSDGTNATRKPLLGKISVVKPSQVARCIPINTLCLIFERAIENRHINCRQLRVYFCPFPVTQHAVLEMSKRELQPKLAHIFPLAPKKFQPDQILFSVWTTQHIPPEAMKAPEVQRFLSQRKFWEQVKAEKPVIGFPSSVMGKWKTHSKWWGGQRVGHRGWGVESEEGREIDEKVRGRRG